MKTFGIIADLTRIDAISFKIKAIEEFDFVDLNKNPDLALNVKAIIVLGGDGFLLHVVHRFLYAKKPFYGLNYGTVGFLLNNKVELSELPDKILNAKPIKINLLKARIETESSCIESFAMNEVTLFRAAGQVAKIRIFVDGKMQMEELVSDGIVLSTATGSTAYNFSLHGPIFSPNANVLSLCPISPFRPRHFRGALLLNTANVRFEVLEQVKRPVLATSDFHHFHNVKSLEAYLSDEDFVEILFEKDVSLDEKILQEQFAL